MALAETVGTMTLLYHYLRSCQIITRRAWWDLITSLRHLIM